MPKRIVLLVRHGQYHFDPGHARYGELTALGKRQSLRLARRLADFPLDRLYTSTAVRAQQTALAFKRYVPRLHPQRCHVLLEGIPTPPPGYRSSPKAMARVRGRMDRVFDRFFKPARGRDRCDVLVCHGNLIRYLMRRALGDDVRKWWRAEIGNCGISTLEVRAGGDCRVLGYNDVGHLPPSMQTVA